MTAEQINFEQRKLLAAFLTALGVALMAAGLFKPASDFLAGVPSVAFDPVRFGVSLLFVSGSVAFHLAGQWILWGGTSRLWPPSDRPDSSGGAERAM